jgi:hypothetical protein
MSSEVNETAFVADLLVQAEQKLLKAPDPVEMAFWQARRDTLVQWDEFNKARRSGQ